MPAAIASNSENLPVMKPMAWWRHAIAYVTLGLLCGWYYFLLVLYPFLLFAMYRGSYLAGAIFTFFIAISFTPLDHNVWPAFTSHWIWKIWTEYFDFTYDVTTLKAKYNPEERYFFFEAPHGVFPMGQFLSVSVVDEITPGKDTCGTAADVVFKFPVMRQIMAWIGTHPANRKSIQKIFKSGHNCAVVVGGIAEMYLMNRETEGIYWKKRLNTVKIAMQEGANIVPLFFFGNTRLFDIAGQSGSDSFISKMSRKMRASIMFFYGRHYLPVPYRHPIHMLTGEVIKVEKKENPTDEEAQKVLDYLLESIQKTYTEKKPAWETRPLAIH